MNVMKYMVAGMAAFSLVAGCKTIVVQTSPDNAKVATDEATLTSPAPVEASLFGKKTVTVSKDGYAPRTVTLSFSSPNPYNVSLDRKFNIRANEEGATVKVDGAVKGKTPMKGVAINDGVESVVTVSKPGWLEAKMTVMPDTPTDIELVMDKDGAGRYLINLKPTQDGVRVEPVKIHSDTDVGESSPNVAQVRRLTSHGDGQYLQNISLLPDGATLVASIIEEYIENCVKLYRANLWKLDTSKAGAPRQQLTIGDFYDITPNASVDGETLYFSTTRNGRLGIWSLNMNKKSGLKMLPVGNTADYLPAINPMGDEIVYSAVLTTGTHPAYLWTRAADGSGMPSQLRKGYDAVWNSDGTKLLFVDGSFAEGKARIYVMDADGGNVTQLTTDPGKFNDIDPRWSPDGTKIVFSSNRSIVKGRNNYDIYMMDANGENVTQLTTNSSCDDRPVFAPDGRTIFFRSNRGLNWDIWVMELNQ